MPSSHPLPTSCQWFAMLAAALDPLSAESQAALRRGATEDEITDMTERLLGLAA